MGLEIFLSFFFFSWFKEFPPRYVPGTEFSGRPVEISLEGQPDSNGIVNIHEKEYTTPRDSEDGC